MSELSFRRVVRTGLAPLMEVVPEGPEWTDLTPETALVPSRSARFGWIAGVGAAVVVLVVIGVTAFLTGEDPVSPPATDTTEPGLTEVFQPPTRTVNGETYLDLTLLDGSQITLAYPADLDLTSQGAEAEAPGGVGGAVTGFVFTKYGPPEDLIAQLEADQGSGELTNAYTAPDGSTVEKWDFPDISYLVFDFSPWTAYVRDSNLEVSNVAEGWANSLHGTTDANGFLVLTANSPLELLGAADSPGSSYGQDIRVDGSSGSLFVFVNDCELMTQLDEGAYGDEVFAFCDEPTNTLFSIFGDAEVQERIHKGLRVNPDGQPTTTTTVPPTTSTTQPEIRETPPGWAITEIPFTIREGSSYATGGRWFFAWGGSVDRTGDLRSDGILIDVDSGDWVLVPEAPISGRYQSSIAWTGSTFVVFGGQDFERSLVDGAVFDPETLRWTAIAPAPLAPAAVPAAVWDGDELTVWLAGQDSNLAESPGPAMGQMATYDPSSDEWSLLPAPNIDMVDADLLMEGDDIVLVGGPAMRDNPYSLTRSLYGTRWNNVTGEWTEPLLGPGVDSARLLILPGGATGVFTDRGRLLEFQPDGWNELPIGSDLPPETTNCWWDIGTGSGGGQAYLKLCGYDFRITETGGLDTIIEPDHYGSTANLFASAFVVDDQGRLIVFGDSPLPSSTGTPNALFGVYTP